MNQRRRTPKIAFEVIAKVIYTHPKSWDGANFPRVLIAERQSIAPMASEIVSGRVQLLKSDNEVGDLRQQRLGCV